MVYPRWVKPTKKFWVLLLLYYPIKWRDTTCNKPASLPLHSLTVFITSSQRPFYNSTIQYIGVLQGFPFIGELPWENNMGHPITWYYKLLSNKNPPKKYFRGFTPEPPLRATWPLDLLATGDSPPRRDTSPLHPPIGMSVQWN